MSVSGSKRISDTFDIILPKVRGLAFCFMRKERMLIVTVILEYPSVRSERV